MIITFCGHSDFTGSAKYEQQILTFLNDTVGMQEAEIYLGNYGNFDRFSYSCCKKYQKTHPKVSLLLIAPYLTVAYQKNHLEQEKAYYDGIIYPELENTPPRFSISYRNRWMVKKSDYIIAYIDHAWGGAYATYKYAKCKRKNIFNLGALKE